jgi:F0F1-type ATP synthase assembly protein I
VKNLRYTGPVLQLSWVVVISALVPLGIGLWLDRRLGTAPLFILIGGLVGILASTIGAVRTAIRMIEALEDVPLPKARPEGEQTGKEDSE